MLSPLNYQKNYKNECYPITFIQRFLTLKRNENVHSLVHRTMQLSDNRIQ